MRLADPEVHGTRASLGLRHIEQSAAAASSLRQPADALVDAVSTFRLRAA